MRTATRLGLFGAGLAVVFGASFVVAGAVVPDEVVAQRLQDDATQEHDMPMPTASGPTTDPAGHGTTGHGPTGHGTTGHGDAQDTGGDTHGDHAGHDAADDVKGLAAAQDGFRLTGLSSPTAAGRPGPLSFSITDATGAAVTDFTVSHDKRLHLIVVRTDGTGFQHLHPTMSTDGTWSLPVTFPAGGSYRVFADFVPASTGEGLTLTSTVEVAGDYTPAHPNREVRRSAVGGMEVTLTGDLLAGQPGTLVATVTRDGAPVTALEPYLGAFGHLVALRQGDLGYLHVHPEGEQPQPDDTSGPTITFGTTAPTPGRYLLYLDFQVDGAVHTAAFVVTAHAADQHGTADHGATGGHDGAGHDSSAGHDDHGTADHHVTTTASEGP